MKKGYIYYFILFSLFLISSCELEEHIGIQEMPNSSENIEPTVFVQGILTSELKYQTVTLTKSFQLGGNPDTISDAIVVVYVGNKTYNYIESIHHPTYPEEFKEKGLYASLDKIQGEVGKLHSLHILHNNKEYIANDSMISVQDFDFTEDNIPRFGYGTMPGTNKTELDIGGIYFGQNQSYMLTWSWCEWWGFNEEMIREYKLNYSTGYYFEDYASPEISNNSFRYLTNRPIEPHWDSLVTTQKLSISDNYKNFLIQTFNETLWNTSLFSSTPANISTNVNNGGLGFFAACDVKTKKIVFRELYKKAENTY